MAVFAKIFLDGSDQSSTFDLVSLAASEQLGRAYQFRFVVLSHQPSLSPRQLLGKSFGACFSLQNGVVRWFNGVVLRLGRGPQQGHRHEYWLDVQPDFALLGYRSDARIFQDKSVIDIFSAVVSRLPSLGWQFRGGSLPHRAWEYCVQYQETDLNFAMRLLEQEGIYFWFDHLADTQTQMVLSDDNGVSQQLSQPTPVLTFNPNAYHTDRPQDYLHAWSRDSSLVSGTAELGDFDFQRPMQKREVRSTLRSGHARDDMELFFYPGEFDTVDEGRSYADVRMQSIQARHAVYRGETVSPGIHVGHVIHVRGHPVADMNGDFLVTATDHTLTSHALDAGSGQGAGIECGFTAIPAAVQFRPERVTPKSTIFGPQTAFVVGPEKNEIHTDEHGRIRVQFHWDRHGKPTEDTSCWIRTAQPWANQGFGSWTLPRVGSEVVVQFLDGDPDRPIVIGSVYNGENRIPYPQPANKTRSGIRTMSTPGGGVEDFNELRFEDKKGEEEVYVQAQKDMNTRVKADATRLVGGNDRLAVEANRNVRVARNSELTVEENRTTTIGANHQVAVGGNETRRVDGDRVVALGSDSLQIQGDCACSTGGSMGISTGQSYALDAQTGIAMSAQMTVDIRSGMTLAMEATSGLSLRCGSSFISLTPAGIFLQGPLVMLNSGGSPLAAKTARPGKAKAVPSAARADAITLADSPPIQPATRRPLAGGLADAARSGSPFVAAG